MLYFIACLFLVFFVLYSLYIYIHFRGKAHNTPWLVVSLFQINQIFLHLRAELFFFFLRSFCPPRFAFLGTPHFPSSHSHSHSHSALDLGNRRPATMRPSRQPLAVHVCTKCRVSFTSIEDLAKHSNQFILHGLSPLRLSRLRMPSARNEQIPLLKVSSLNFQFLINQTDHILLGSYSVIFYISAKALG